MDKRLVNLINEALLQDDFDKDITTSSIVHYRQECSGSFVVKSPGIVSGTEILIETYRIINPNIVIEIVRNDGDYVNKGDVIASIRGRMGDIIKGHQVAINFLQMLSGVATSVDKYAEELKGLECKIVSNRKQIPFLKKFDIDAFTSGGGHHYFTKLSDGISISEHHILAAGSITEAVNLARKRHGDKEFEVYVKNVEEAEEAIQLGVNRIIITSLNIELISEILVLKENDVQIGVCANIPIGKVRELALLGIDFLIIDNLACLNRGVEVYLKLYKRSLLK